MKNYNVPINNLQKNAYTKIDDSRPYISELVQNMPKYWVSGKNYRPISVGVLDSFYVNILAMWIKIILSCLLFKQLSWLLFIALVPHIALSLAISKNTLCISYFWLWMKITNAIYTTSAFKLQIWKSEPLEIHKNII